MSLELSPLISKLGEVLFPPVAAGMYLVHKYLLCSTPFVQVGPITEQKK